MCVFRSLALSFSECSVVSAQQFAIISVSIQRMKFKKCDYTSSGYILSKSTPSSPSKQDKVPLLSNILKGKVTSFNST